MSSQETISNLYSKVKTLSYWLIFSFLIILFLLYKVEKQSYTISNAHWRLDAILRDEWWGFEDRLEWIVYDKISEHESDYH